MPLAATRCRKAPACTKRPEPRSAWWNRNRDALGTHASGGDGRAAGKSYVLLRGTEDDCWCRGHERYMAQPGRVLRRVLLRQMSGQFGREGRMRTTTLVPGVRAPLIGQTQCDGL